MCVYQIDSWWYFKGPDDGVKNWTAMPRVFPNGIEAVVKKTGLPMEAHNRWWYVLTLSSGLALSQMYRLYIMYVYVYDIVHADSTCTCL